MAKRNGTTRNVGSVAASAPRSRADSAVKVSPYEKTLEKWNVESLLTKSMWPYPKLTMEKVPTFINKLFPDNSKERSEKHPGDYSVEYEIKVNGVGTFTFKGKDGDGEHYHNLSFRAENGQTGVLSKSTSTSLINHISDEGLEKLKKALRK